jgi:hypothetical protein
MINYDENSRAVYQADRGNESMHRSAPQLPSQIRMAPYEPEMDNISIETRLLCIAAAFALVLIAVPPS